MESPLGTRVYLDSALLMDMTDAAIPGKPDARPRFSEADVQAVLHAMRDSDALLILSLGHLADVMRNLNERTQARVATLLDQFPRVAMVEGDLSVELIERVERGLMDPMSIDHRWDLPLWEGKSMGSLLLRDSDYRERAKRIAQDNTRHYSFQKLGFELRQRKQANPKWLRELYPRMRFARTREQVETAVREALPQLGFDRDSTTNANDERMLDWAGKFWPWLMELVVQRASAMNVDPSAFFERAIKLPTSVALGIRGVRTPADWKLWCEAALHIAPGLYLAVQLLESNFRDVGRDPDEGDRADIFHALLLPYVDLATVDAHNFAVLDRSWLSARRRPQATLRRNGKDLVELAHAVRGLGARMSRNSPL